MKQKLILLLKTSFASKGFNAKELESLADLIISQQSLTDDSTDEDLTTAVTGAKPVADFVQSVASRQVSDVKKPKVEEPANPAEPAKPAEPTEDMPAWAKALVSSTQALAQGLQAIQAEKVGSTRREQYAKTLEGLTDAQKADKLADFDLFNFKDDEHFNTWNESKAESVKALIQENANNNLGGDRPAGGFGKVPSGEKEVSPLMKGYLETQAAKAPKAVTV